MSGMLYICPTPIGNLEDITLRTLRVLSEVDVIACEDTRHTLKLLNHFELKKKRISYHEHNKNHRGLELIDMLQSGLSIALVSDAGMPGLSDPGADLIRMAIEAQIDYTVLPGANALLPALVGSGLNTDQFLYVGFLESQATKRKKQLEAIRQEPYTLILYEAPHRVLNTLKQALTLLGNRKAVVVRELTKKFETFQRGDLAELITYYEGEAPRGEIVLVIAGYIKVMPVDFEETIEEQLNRLIQEGLSKKEAIKQVATERQLKKQDVYKIATQFGRE